MSGSRDQTVRLWDAFHGKVLSVKQLPKRSSRKDKYDSYGPRDRLWLSVCWPVASPGHVISSSQGYVQWPHYCTFKTIAIFTVNSAQLHNLQWNLALCEVILGYFVANSLAPMLDYIVMQMRTTIQEKGYYSLSACWIWHDSNACRYPTRHVMLSLLTSYHIQLRSASGIIVLFCFINY